jgi:hypothetical protein
MQEEMRIIHDDAQKVRGRCRWAPISKQQFPTKFTGECHITMTEPRNVLRVIKGAHVLIAEDYRAARPEGERLWGSRALFVNRRWVFGGGARRLLCPDNKKEWQQFDFF